ncbi:MAG: peptidoglycan DD-metalloendopeptidase family protein [Rhodospirillaceae bacterium]
MRANKFFEQNTQVRPLNPNEINLGEKNTVIQEKLEPGSQEFLRLYEQLVILTANFQKIAFLIIGARPQFEPNYEELIKCAHFLQGSIATITKKLTRIQDIKTQDLRNFNITRHNLITSSDENENSGPTFSSPASRKENKPSKNITQNLTSSGPIPLKLNPTVVVNGKLAVLYGQKLSEEKKAFGIFYKTSPGSEIFAPRAGKIVFAGTFKGLGKLLIIECSNEYHLLMAGMGRIDAKLGTLVSAGQHVATMDTKKNRDPTLYLELRRNGKTVDPSPWLLSGPN